MTRIELPGKPVNINAMSRGSWQSVSSERKFWRDYALSVAKFTRVKSIAGPVEVHVHRTVTGKLPDCEAAIHAIKASIDGFVDAGVLHDDGPAVVRSITLHAPRKAEHDGLVFELVPVGP